MRKFEHIDTQEYRAYGYAFPKGPERLRQLDEAVQIILAMWTQEEAFFEGTYYQVRGAINQPKGVQKPHIPLLIGGGGEKVTLKLVAKYADACNVLGDPAALERKFAIIREHCQNVGRHEERHSGRLCPVTTICDNGQKAPGEPVRLLAHFCLNSEILDLQMLAKGLQSDVVSQ